MTGRVEVSDREIADAVADGEMLEFLAVYRPGEDLAEFLWAGAAWRQSFDDFREGRRTIRLLETTAA